jgi:hypothetical protein
MLPFRVPGAGVPLYPSIRLVGTPLILGNGAGEYVPPAPSIAAPLDVTWVDGTNPVECVMNVTRPTYPGAIAAGDIPQVRYNGGGTIYSGTAIVDPQNDNPDFSGAGLPTQPAGAGYAQYRFVRDPGGPGEVIGAWSSASEGQFDIVSADPTDYIETEAGGGYFETEAGGGYIQLEAA